MCFLPTPLNSWDGVGDAVKLPHATYPSYVLGLDDGGVLAWNARRPRPDIGKVIVDYGHQRLDVHTVVATSSGTMLQTGPVGGRYQLVGTMTGTGASGRVARWLGANNSQNIVFDTNSGVWTYDVLFRVPTLPGGGITFEVKFGFFDTVTAATTDGAYILFDNNDTEFQCVTRSNSTETKTDSGVTVVAGTWYRATIVVTNASTVAFYICAAGSGSTYGSAKASHNTNIPSGSGRETSGGLYIRRLAGAGDRTLDYCYQQFVQRAPGSGNAPTSFVARGALNQGDGLGISLGGVGTRFQMDRSEPSKPAFTDQELPIECIPFDVIYNRTVTNRTWFDQGSVTPASSAQEDFTQFTTTVAAGSTTTNGYTSLWHGAASPADVPQQVFDSTSETMVYEALIYIPTVSTGANQFVVRLGFNDTLSGAPVDGAFVEIDSSVDTEFQCVTRQNSTETRTDSGVTCNAATMYQIKIVVTNDGSVDFYVKAFGTAYGATVAHHTTNIPSGTTRATSPAIQIDTVAHSNAATRSYQCPHMRAYQRLAA